MKPHEDTEKLKKLADETSSSPDLRGKNEQVIARFLKADFDPRGEARARVLSAVKTGGNRRTARTGRWLAAACASCLLLALGVWHHGRDGAMPPVPPDCYSYYNFPSTGDDAIQFADDTPPDWLADYQFPSATGGK